MPIADLALARRLARAITAYERFRLGLYRARPGNPDRIEVREIGWTTAMRFPAVGYFNQVQGFAVEDCARLPDFARFYEGSANSYKIQAAPDTDRNAVSRQLIAAGFTVRTKTVRLAQARPAPAALRWPAGLTVAPLQAGEVDEFFRIYLECFGAAPSGWPAALENMRRLHGQPGLHCLFARHEGRPIGLGMVYLNEGVAYFCAGAILAPWRELGFQSVLINERLRIASEAGCDLAASWTEDGSVSHRNLLRAGFALSYHDPVWLSPCQGRQ